MALANVPRRYPPLILSPEEIAWLVKSGGPEKPDGGFSLPLGQSFTPSQQATAIAIILAESGGNVYALNNTPPDESYGLAQINMLGNLGPDRRARYGLKSNEDLYMADLNVAVMAALSSGGSNWKPWTTFVTKAHLVHMGRAQSALASPKDPRPRLKDPAQQQAANEANDNPLEQLLNWIKEQMQRVAGFVGGGVLLILAIVIYVRWQSR